MLTILISAAAAGALPDSYLERTCVALEACRACLPSMQPPAEAAAAHLAAGGKLWIAGQSSMTSELTGRAGGFMMARGLRGETAGTGDVVLYFVEPDMPAPDAAALGGYVVYFGGGPREDAPWFSNHAAESGLSPTFANAIPGWLFTGELIAALTRLGKMPVVYESIGMYDGIARMQQYKNGETAFHDDLTVPPVAHGVTGNRFADIVAGMLRRVAREEQARLECAGAWAREAREAGKRLYMYSMGHLFPDEVGKTAMGELFHSDVWNAGFRRHAKPGDAFGGGDFVALIGYQHAPDDLLLRARSAGARAAYVTLHAARDYANDSGVVWIDPMWDWPDACVPLEGYDVPLLAASGIVNGAIAWEIYQLTTR
ncbi:MAG: hypothetical protein KA184_15900 [Candidatus Hydrogenedentes bacterium]|nr:hypothetical protein [Candidatus Hydrogenedentota bacterium]